MVFICEHGHIEELSYKFGGISKVPRVRHRVCKCGSKQSHVGNVDDDDGDATTYFYKKCISQEKEVSKKYNSKTHVLSVDVKLPRYEIITANHLVNYDTGERM